MAGPVCSIPGCSRKYYGRGYCSAHYQRWRTHGDALAGQTEKGAAQLEMQKALQSVDAVNCWIWPYNKLPQGYGQILWHGKMSRAHRVVCEIAHGSAPTPKHHAAHSCGQSACINPFHLSWKTASENERDKRLHGTAQIGEGNGVAKLTDDQVRDIVRLRKSGATQPELAKQFGVTQPTISDIVNGKRWTHVTAQMESVDGR